MHKTIILILLSLSVTITMLLEKVVSEDVPSTAAVPSPTAASSSKGHDLQEIDKLLKKGDYRTAITILTELIKENPKNGSLFASRGRALMDSGLCTHALHDFDEALRLSPEQINSIFQKATCLQRLSRSDEALAALNNLVFKYPTDVSVHYRRGLYLFGIKEFADSVESYNKAIELNPNQAEVYDARSAAYVALGDMAEALKDMNKAIELQPNNAFYYCHRASYFYQEGLYSTALGDLNKGLRLNANLSELSALKGVIQVKLGEFQAGMESLNKAISIDSKNYNAYYNRGFLKYMQNKIIEAEADFNLAMKSDPRFKITY